jgi:hypothetical protein
MFYCLWATSWNRKLVCLTSVQIKPKTSVRTSLKIYIVSIRKSNRLLFTKIIRTYCWYNTKHNVWQNTKFLDIILKEKCTLVQALRLCTGRTAHRGSRGIALLFHDYGTRKGWEVSVTPRPLFTPGKDPVPIVQETGWVPGPVWTGAENLAPAGIRCPDRPARSHSLYLLRYHAHMISY